jgi:hypothetical protein
MVRFSTSFSTKQLRLSEIRVGKHSSPSREVPHAASENRPKTSAYRFFASYAAVLSMGPLWKSTPKPTEPVVSRKRSGILLSVGICNIAMGCLALLCGTCGGGGIVFVSRVQRELIDFMNDRIFAYLAWEVAKHGMTVLLGTMLILAGIGLIMQRRWGWLLTLFCAPCTLLLQVAYIVFQVLCVLPAVHDFQRQFLGNELSGPEAQGRAIGNAVGIFFAAGVPCAYAVATIIVLLLPVTLRDLRAAESAREDDSEQCPKRDSNDEDWEERPRRVM